MLVYGECECFVMQLLYVCVLCASCGSSQCCVMHDLQFVNAGRGCNRRPHPVAVSAFMICRGLCACTEMWMCVLYLSFGSKVRLRTFGCVAMGCPVLFILRRATSVMASQFKSQDQGP